MTERNSEELEPYFDAVRKARRALELADLHLEAAHRYHRSRQEDVAAAETSMAIALEDHLQA